MAEASKMKPAFENAPQVALETVLRAHDSASGVASLGSMVEVRQYCSKFLVQRHSDSESENDSLEASYRKLQTLLTVLEGQAIALMNPNQVVSNLQGQLLSQLVAIARNIALLASAGTFQASSSAWGLLRTFVEIWVEVRLINDPLLTTLPQGQRDQDFESLQRERAHRYNEQVIHQRQKAVYLGKRLAEAYTLSAVTSLTPDELQAEDEAAEKESEETEGYLGEGLNKHRLHGWEWVDGSYVIELQEGEKCGRFKGFIDRERFGFIKPDEDGKDLFVHRNHDPAGEGYKSLSKGAKVAYKPEESPKGLNAKDVRTLQLLPSSLAGWVKLAGGSAELVSLLNIAVHQDAIHLASTVDTRNPTVILQLVLPSLKQAFDGAVPKDQTVLDDVHTALDDAALKVAIDPATRYGTEVQSS
jgi:CspA family cold shock protein